MDSSIPKPHLLAIPFPVPGHVNPLTNLCYKIASEGIRVTFVVTTIDSKPSRTTRFQQEEEEEEEVGLPLIKFVSLPFPDGLENNTENMNRLLNLAVEIENENEPITAVLADASVGWVLEVADKIGAQQFVFWNASPRGLVYLRSIIPELNQDSDEELQVNNNQSSWIVWKEKMMANMGINTIKRIQEVKSILTNAFYDLDSSSCKLIPKMLPIGPLINKSISSNSKNTIISQENDATSSFSSSCLEWLDDKPNKSVVYVAFGGTGGAMSQCQFDELAHGLELSGQSFLWVVRPSNNTDNKSKTSLVLNNGRIVEWAPQEKVLAHPAIACFLTHCGWNSILEGISFGVPFLCWPNFGEQFFHQDYVSEILKVGLKLDVDLENGVRSRMEISTKIQMLLSNSSIKENALKLKVLSEESIDKNGSSNQNLQSFINQLKL